MTREEKPKAFGKRTVQICRRGKGRNILYVALSRPKVRNCLSDEAYDDLTEVLRMAARDPSISAVVLTGCGEYFSSGADLKSGSFTPEKGGRHTLFKPAGRFMMELVSFPKILAAAVNGPAIGIGVTLLLHCDLVHCSSRATFWVPFTRLALVPELASSVTFLNSCGLSKANELLLLGKKITAQKAMEYNICSEVIDCDFSDDPFQPESLGSRMCDEIDQKLLSLPKSEETVKYFVDAVKGHRRGYMEQIVRDELLSLDQRFDRGDVQEAARKLRIGSNARRKPRSRL